jgi:hypothetical protein
MRGRIFIFVLIAWLVCGTKRASGQADPSSTTPPNASAAGGAEIVDGIAARIEDDIITESEVRELAAFQELVDGQAKPRAELIRELADQWIVRGEASTAKYPQPSTDDVEGAYAQLVKQFPSQEEFQSRCAAAGLTEAAVRRMLAQQLYLSRFLDFRFRPAAQVDDKQIQAYYNDEFAPQLKARGQAVPPLPDVEDTIREVLIQRAINQRAAEWLDETRSHLRIDVVKQGANP